ncbi:hypothetical protein QOZ80_9AG0689760 [Eleusine coracana subsp. coracana]|nr:hypothetical protein QOZ80_9AG0689760 [Eleusine coracana subsp. coracana]
MGGFFSSSATSDSTIISAPSVISKSHAGAQILRLKGYSKIKGIGVGNSIKSNVFTVGGHSWYVQCYPEGSWQGCAGWISLFLHLDRTAPNWKGNVRAKFEFCLLDENGQPVQEYRVASPIHTFSLVSGYRNQYRGYTQFIRRRTLEWLYLTQDVLRIRCDVTVVIEEATVETTSVRPESLLVPTLAAKVRDLHHHFRDLLASKVGADVTFKVSGQKFLAHRIVLAARSPVFMAELFGQMKEKYMACIQIDDMDASVFNAMLHFIYTDSLPELDERDKVAMAQHLIVAADRYGLEKLKYICMTILVCDMNSTNVTTTLVLAEQHGFNVLKEVCFMCLERLGDRKVAFMASDGFQHLKSSCPCLFEEVLGKLGQSSPAGISSKNDC